MSRVLKRLLYYQQITPFQGSKDLFNHSHFQRTPQENVSWGEFQTLYSWENFENFPKVSPGLLATFQKRGFKSWF